MDRAKLHVGLFRALASCLAPMGEAHVWLMFKKDLREPLTPFRARLPIETVQADPSDMDELARFTHPDDPERAAEAADGYRNRLRFGASCFLARIDGRIVAFDWLRRRGAVGVAEVPMTLKDDEVYGTEAFTAEAWRGHGIHPALNYTMLRHAQLQGYRIAYTQARADNAQSLATLRRLGWTLSGTLLVFQPAWATSEPIWLVLGSPYPMPVAGLASSRLPTLAELFEQKKFDHRVLVKSRPWSFTYGLHRGDAIFYLKIVPREHAPGLKVAETVARAFPGHAPKGVASNTVFESWLLTQDHGGTGLDDDAPASQLRVMLETYATLQAGAVKNPELLRALPAAPVDGVVQALLDFLSSAAGRDNAASAGAAFFIGTAEARRCFDAVSRAKAVLQAHVAPAIRLPLTLNHGNLRPSHAALVDGGHCVLLNWTRAQTGPVGLSLHPLLASQLPLTVLLSGAAGRTPDADDGNALLTHYVKALVRGGYADEETLNRCLPAAITAGVLLDVLHMARYPMEDPDELREVGAHLATQLNLVVDLCGRLLAQSPGGGTGSAATTV
jgi:RimJ/RimL family protein N-acetyltransferase